MKKKHWIIALAAAIALIVGLAGCEFQSTGEEDISAEEASAHPGEAKTPAQSMYGKNYQDVEEIFKQRGFTNISTEKIEDLITGWMTKDGEVEEVSVAGEVNYTKNKWVPADTKVVIRYHTFPESKAGGDSGNADPQTSPDPTNPKPADDSSLSYSTNDKETAKKGNSGVFSYKKSGQYDIYIIIDFDEGYVYYFCEGNGDTSCDRLRIESGDLNEGLMITYHDGGDSWSDWLHFKWKNQPDHLVLVDNDGLDYDFNTTNLNDALALRNTKTVHDY